MKSKCADERRGTGGMEDDWSITRDTGRDFQLGWCVCKTWKVTVEVMMAYNIALSSL